MEEKQNDNIIFLNVIYQNAQMGVIGIEAVMDKITDDKLSKVFHEQLLEYENIGEAAREILLKYGAKEEDVSKMKEAATKMMSKMMAKGKDNSGIAKLLIQGNEKGVIEARENLNQYQGDDEEIINLAEKLLATEEHNIKEMKEFL